DRLSADELPLVFRKAAELFLHGQEGAGVLHGRLDFQSIADDALVLQELLNTTRVVACDALRIEFVERRAIRVAFAQDGDPREPRLRAFEHEELEQAPIVADGDAPLPVVIADVRRVVAGPATANLFRSTHASSINAARRVARAAGLVRERAGSDRCR